MEIANYIKEAAKQLLEQTEVVQLPAKLAGTEFYLTHAYDETILAHGAITAKDGTEYKIGTKR